MLSRDADSSMVGARVDSPIDRTDALARVLGLGTPLAPASMTLREASGLWMASDVVATASVPAFDQSDLDGFALQSTQVASASPANPILLPVSQVIVAGDHVAPELQPGTAARIMTGALIPHSSDAVLEFEKVEIDEATGCIVITSDVVPGRNVRVAGEQVLAGSRVSRAGDVLTPARAGLLASVGIDSVFARRRPRVALVVTGEELVTAGKPREPGEVYDALTPLLDGYIRATGAEPVIHHRAPDDAETLRILLERIARDDRPDLIVTTAGISAGDRDVVRSAFEQGDDVHFLRVRMKPGRPLAYGRVCDLSFVGLPGNPLAAAVSFLQFVVPMIRRMAGDMFPLSHTLLARASTELMTDPASDRVLCGVLESDREGRLLVTSVDDPGRQGLHSLARANCLMIVPRTGHDSPHPAYVEVHLLPGADIGRNA